MGAQSQPLYFVFHLFAMKIKALFTMITFLNNLVLMASSITFGLATLKRVNFKKSMRGYDEKTHQPPHLDSISHLYESASAKPFNLSLPIVLRSDVFSTFHSKNKAQIIF